MRRAGKTWENAWKALDFGSKKNCRHGGDVVFFFTNLILLCETISFHSWGEYALAASKCQWRGLKEASREHFPWLKTSVWSKSKDVIWSYATLLAQYPEQCRVRSSDADDRSRKAADFFLFSAVFSPRLHINVTMRKPRWFEKRDQGVPDASDKMGYRHSWGHINFSYSVSITHVAVNCSPTRKLLFCDKR